MWLTTVSQLYQARRQLSTTPGRFFPLSSVAKPHGAATTQTRSDYTIEFDIRPPGRMSGVLSEVPPGAAQ